jgi:hypothetical protein
MIIVECLASTLVLLETFTSFLIVALAILVIDYRLILILVQAMGARIKIWI